MVNIIENWVSIEGMVKSVKEQPALKGYYEVAVELAKTYDVEGFPNLARADEGHIIHLNVKPEQIASYDIKQGKIICGKARKAYGQVYFMD